MLANLTRLGAREDRLWGDAMVSTLEMASENACWGLVASLGQRWSGCGRGFGRSI